MSRAMLILFLIVTPLGGTVFAGSYPTCAGPTYTYGDPLAGQATPPDGEADPRWRAFTVCVPTGLHWKTATGEILRQEKR